MSIVERLAKIYKTPRQVQFFLNTIDYNAEADGETICSAESALLKNKAHCLEATFIAAAILERHGYPPLILSLESTYLLDHVVFLFKSNKKWGCIGKSREKGLQGRAPAFHTIHDIVDSYFDPFVDRVGRIRSYEVFHLDECPGDWRNANHNLWSIQQFLGTQKHKKFIHSKRRYKTVHQRFLDKGPILQGPHWW